MSKPTPDESDDNSVIDTKTVRTLAMILKSTGLTEIEVERGDLRIRVARELTAAPAHQTYVAAPVAPAARTTCQTPPLPSPLRSPAFWSPAK